MAEGKKDLIGRDVWYVHEKKVYKGRVIREDDFGEPTGKKEYLVYCLNGNFASKLGENIIRTYYIFDTIEEAYDALMEEIKSQKERAIRINKKED